MQNRHEQLNLKELEQIGLTQSLGPGLMWSCVHAGNRFFKRAQAAERYAGKKKAAYAALVWQHSLKKKVGYAPVIFEVSDGFLDSVSQLPSKATEVAGKNKVKLAAADWSWSAMDWSSFHAQVLSFEINKMTALAVLSGLQSAVAAVEAAN